MERCAGTSRSRKPTLAPSRDVAKGRTPAIQRSAGKGRTPPEAVIPVPLLAVCRQRKGGTAGFPGRTINLAVPFAELDARDPAEQPHPPGLPFDLDQCR